MDLKKETMEYIWKFFFLAIASVVVMIGGRCGLAVIDYLSYDRAVDVPIETWSIIEVAPSEYKLQASYPIPLLDGKMGTHQIIGRSYFNKFIAEQHLKELKKKNWKLFYQSNNPLKNTLQHHFPFKECVHLLLAFAVITYFVWLRKYVTSRYALDT